MTRFGAALAGVLTVVALAAPLHRVGAQPPAPPQPVPTPIAPPTPTPIALASTLPARSRMCSAVARVSAS